MLASPELFLFVIAALRWSQEPLDHYARDLISNPYSGVSNEVANALLVAASRGGTLLNTITEERIALPSSERDVVFGFSQKLRTLQTNSTSHAKGEDTLASVIKQFALPPETDTFLGAARRSSGQSEGWNLDTLIVEMQREGARAAQPPPLATQLALKDPAAPEEPAPLQTRPTHFSASSLNTYVECRRKWFYRYMCAAVEDRGSSASFYGSAFHAALEALHQEFPRPGEVAEQTLSAKLQAHLNVAFDRYRSGFDTSVEFELQRRRARRTAKRYVGWLCAHAARRSFTVVGCELAAETDVEGFKFIGYIDRLDRDDASAAVTVIDYKTGSIAASAEEYREKVRQFKEFQLPFYYWARTTAGDRVSRLALVPLKDALLDVAPIELEVVPLSSEVHGRRPHFQTTGVISIGELERARAKMVEICKELTQAGVPRFDVTDEPLACKYCVYVSACIFRPPPAEERFAR